MYIKFVLILLFSLASFSVKAQEFPYMGIWQGEIAGKQVMVCFAPNDQQYYYLEHKVGISLEKDESTADFTRWTERIGRQVEGKQVVTGIWTIPWQKAGDTLELTWSSPDGKRKWPVTLKKAPPSTSTPPVFVMCEMAFYGPIEKAMRFAYQNSTGGQPIARAVTTATGSAFELSPAIAGSRQFNRYVQEWLVGTAVAAYECRRFGQREWKRTLQPLLWSKTRLVVKDAIPATYCGSDRGYIYLDYISFDLRSGHKIDTWTWLRQGKDSVQIAFENDPPGILRGLLEKQVVTKQCRPYNHDFTVAEPYADKKGMVFRIFYDEVNRQCDTELLIPYQRIKKYLTLKGRAAVAEMK